jgi:hypothetical protein
MKTKLYFKSLLGLAFLLLTGITVAQNYDGSKTLNKTMAVPEGVSIQFSNQSGDLKIVTTNENTVTLITDIDVSARSMDEVNQVIDAVANLKFDLHGNEMEIDTRFYKNLVTVVNKKTMTLLNGDKIRIGEFTIRHELHIPKTAEFKLNNKYSDIEMQSFDGVADFDLYSSKLYAGDFSKKVRIDAKYSKINLQDIAEEAVFNFYDTDIKFNSCGDANIKSKYSKFEASKTGALTIDSYDDKFYFTEATSLNLKAKYSDFISKARTNDIFLELYDCNIQASSAKYATYSGKYSDLNLGDVKEFRIAESYDDNFQFRKTADIQVRESKYSKYKMDEAASFTIDGYNDDVVINQLNPKFSEIRMNGKYGKLSIDAGNVPFQVNFKIKYPKIDIPESVKIVKQIKDNSDLELVGGESGGKISVEGYDMKVVIND